MSKPQAEQGSMTKQRKAIGELMLVAAIVAPVLIGGYEYPKPTPSGAWVVGGVLAVVGMIILAPWWLRWLTGK